MKGVQDRDFVFEANRVRDNFKRRNISFTEAFNDIRRINADAVKCGYIGLTGEKVARILLNRQVGFDKFLTKKAGAGYGN